MTVKNTIKKSALTPTVVVAGGAGFIGSRLSEILLEKGARVVVLDNFKTGKQNQVEHLLNNPNFALFDANINEGVPAEIEGADYIFHLAALETYNVSKVNLDSLLTNAVGTKNLLDFTKKCDGKFLLVSSIDVYQGQLSPLDLRKYFGQTEEEENKFELAEARRFAEAMVWEYFKNYDEDVRIVRLPEVYGPRMDEDSGGALGSLIQELVRNHTLTIKGEGLNKEYYLYIEDAVNGVVKALMNPNTKGKIYTLIEKEPYTPLEIAYLLKTLANQPVDVKFDRSYDVPVRNLLSPDISNHSGLRWGVRTDFKEGIKLTLESMGYETSERSFKPANVIEKRAKEVKSEEFKEAGSLLTLQDLKSEDKSTKPKKIRKPFHLKEKLGKIFKPKEEKVKTYIKEVESSEKVFGVNPDPITLSTSKDINFAGDTKVIDRTKPKKAFKPNFEVTKKTSVIFALLSSFLAASLIFIGLPTIQTSAYTKSAMKSLEKMPVTLTQLQSEQGKEQANEAFQNFNKARDAFSRLRWLYKTTGKASEYNSTVRLLNSAAYFSEAMYNVSKALIPFNNIWGVINPNSEETLSQEEFSQIAENLRTANNAINFAQAEYKNVEIDALPKRFNGKVAQYGMVLKSVSDSFQEVSVYLADISNLLGVEETKRYLVLLQNSNEIRPTGGFIGSYAVIEVNKGKITNLEIDDIYNPDGQLDSRNIKIEPPQPIASLLNEDRLYIRNANWNPNFTESARTIQELFFKIDGKTFDGVLAMDLEFTKKMLELTGPVFLTSYNEEISSANLAEKAQYYSEFNYEKGISQKKSFLSMLTSKMLEKLFALEREKIPVMLSGMQDMLNEKHLSIYLPQTSLSSLIKEKGWDGDMVVYEDKDYLYIVNANLGGTKANYYVKNSYNYRVTSDTRDGILRAELTLNYTNEAETDSWPGGPYTDYLRVYAGKGAKLTGATRGDTDIFKEVITAEGDFTSFETQFTLNPKESISITLNYDLPPTISLSKDTRHYSLYWQKQAGTKGDLASLEFVPPMGLEVEGGNRLEKTLDTDWEVNLSLR